jgi:predicted glycosyltransferase involved in capsule biosynthesis
MNGILILQSAANFIRAKYATYKPIKQNINLVNVMPLISLKAKEQLNFQD